MKETLDRHQTVLTQWVVGALIVILVGGFVGIVNRVTVPTETSHVTKMNNQLSLDAYTKELQKTPNQDAGWFGTERNTYSNHCAR